jgi:hypothetical protein
MAERTKSSPLTVYHCYANPAGVHLYGGDVTAERKASSLGEAGEGVEKALAGVGKSVALTKRANLRDRVRAPATSSSALPTRATRRRRSKPKCEQMAGARRKR